MMVAMKQDGGHVASSLSTIKCASANGVQAFGHHEVGIANQTILGLSPSCKDMFHKIVK